MTALDWPTGLSVLDERLYRHLIDHIDSETALVKNYEDLAADSGAEHVAYLVKMIADDEKRHHGLFREWANALRSEAEMRDITPRVPHLRREHNPEELIERTEELIAHERKDAKELKGLRDEIKDVKDTTIWGLLIEIMRLDTEKHQMILEFIRDHARRTAKGKI